MAFVFDCAGWSTSCVLLSHLAVTWMTQGVIAGERRALLSVQVGPRSSALHLAVLLLRSGTHHRLLAVQGLVSPLMSPHVRELPFSAHCFPKKRYSEDLT
jgi:hypothetical protein